MTDQRTRDWVVAADDPELAAAVVTIAKRLGEREGEISAHMTDLIAREVEPLDASDLGAALHASVHGNVTTMLDILEHNISLADVEPIRPAVDYALLLAQRGVPPSSLRRAYHFGSDDLREAIFGEISSLDVAADLKLRLLHQLDSFIHKYIDWITQIVLLAHEEERRLWLNRTAGVTATLVREVLSEHSVDRFEFAEKTRYGLEQAHVGAVLWIEHANPGLDHTRSLQSIADAITEVIGPRSAVLFTAVDRSTAWVWFGRGEDRSPIDVNPVRTRLERFEGARITFGLPEVGVPGFRQSHQQAESVVAVVRAASGSARTAVSFGDRGMAIVAMLARDLDATKTWVGDVLGPLANDTESEAMLRETLRVFLETGRSHTQTAEQLMLHRNSVRYRIRKAEAVRQRPVDVDRLDVEVALHACHLLGAAVLTSR
ncbi:CdaR family transcriptional regulator [Nocardia sp. 348MFTsu5.1]|uniref:PucR family transcriptional regulator n=1 Tax=Nocardia sp. 348MFTsu5.1 TaxID=1172185 RepID=UPI00036ACA8E|nr:helix-turn-helix domain-containing protein [Nocardia sp. 348MFTsu5.1]